MHANTFLVRRFLATFVLIILAAAWTISLGSPHAWSQSAGGGAVDPVFGGASLGLGGNVRVTAVQPDGRVLVGGLFQSGIARLNTDGTTDNSFRPADVVGVTALAVQADGKVLAAGGLNNLIRLNADGSPDADFHANANNSIYALAVQADGKIVLGGQFTRVNGVARNNSARLNADGSLDASFSASVNSSIDGVRSLILQPDGKLVLGGSFTQVNGVARSGIARLNTDGSLDPGFTASVSGGTVYSLAAQADGKVVAGGGFTQADGVARSEIARFNADGSLDTTFNANSNGRVYTLTVQGDGKLVLGGTFSRINGVSRARVARLNPDGSLDANFTASADASVFTAAVLPDGKLVLGGSFVLVSGVTRSSVARLNADGSLDGGFVPDVAPGPNGPVYALTVQSDGKLLIGGHFDVVNGVARGGVARLNPDASLDASLAASVNVSASTDGVRALVLQTDGKLVLGGSFTQVNGVARDSIARLNADGSLDAAFNPSVDTYLLGVRTLVEQADGKLLLGGDFDQISGVARSGVARLNPDGSLDATFNPSLSNGSFPFPFVYALAVQPDGKVLLGGQFTQVNGMARNGFARLNPDGSLDAGFSASVSLSFTDPSIRAVAVQPDGKLVLGGDFDQVSGVTRRFDLARVNMDGSLDGDFNASVSNGTVSTLAVQSDGKIVVGGDFTQVNELDRRGLARLNADGSLDPGFDPGGAGTDGGVIAVTLQPDGKILAGGEFTSVNGQLRNHVARFTGDANRPKPLVSIVNAGPSRGGFLVSRVGGQLGQPLTVAYHVGGAAIGGEDYQTLSGRIAFKAGRSEKVILVQPFPGANRNHKVKVFLDPSSTSDYDLGGAAQGKVFLNDLP